MSAEGAATWDTNIADAREQLAAAQLPRAERIHRQLALRAAEATPWTDAGWYLLDQATDGLPELDAEEGAPFRVYGAGAASPA